MTRRLRRKRKRARQRWLVRRGGPGVEPLDPFPIMYRLGAEMFLRVGRPVPPVLEPDVEGTPKGSDEDGPLSGRDQLAGGDRSG